MVYIGVCVYVSMCVCVYVSVFLCVCVSKCTCVRAQVYVCVRETETERGQINAGMSFIFCCVHRAVCGTEVD